MGLPLGGMIVTMFSSVSFAKGRLDSTYSLSTKSIIKIASDATRAMGSFHPMKHSIHLYQMAFGNLCIELVTPSYSGLNALFVTRLYQSTLKVEKSPTSNILFLVTRLCVLSTLQPHEDAQDVNGLSLSLDQVSPISVIRIDAFVLHVAEL